MYVYPKPQGLKRIVAELNNMDELDKLVWNLKLNGYPINKCKILFDTKYTDTPFMGDQRYTVIRIVLDEKE